jgi:hypothetical protein
MRRAPVSTLPLLKQVPGRRSRDPIMEGSARHPVP